MLNSPSHELLIDVLRKSGAKVRFFLQINKYYQKKTQYFRIIFAF